MSENEGIKAIGPLNAYSFVTRQAYTVSLTLHRLVWLATRTWLRKSQEFTHQIMRAADHFSEVFPRGELENRRLWREHLPHGLSRSREHHFKSERERYTALLQRIAICLDWDGRYREAEKLEVEVLEIEAGARARASLHSDQHGQPWPNLELQGNVQGALALLEECVQLRKRSTWPGSSACQNLLQHA